MVFYEFTYACLRKLEKKEEFGWTGWDFSHNQEVFESEIRNRIKKELTQKNLVNIANYCMFLWNLKTEAKNESKIVN